MSFLTKTFAPVAVVLFGATAAHADNETWGQDKDKHALVGTAIYTGGRAVGFNGEQALMACAAAGIAKEIRDEATGAGTPEIADAVATVLPCALGYIFEQLSGKKKAATVVIEDDPRVSLSDRRALIEFANRMP